MIAEQGGLGEEPYLLLPVPSLLSTSAVLAVLSALLCEGVQWNCMSDLLLAAGGGLTTSFFCLSSFPPDLSVFSPPILLTEAFLTSSPSGARWPDAV